MEMEETFSLFESVGISNKEQRTQLTNYNESLDFCYEAAQLEISHGLQYIQLLSRNEVLWQLLDTNIALIQDYSISEGWLV